MNQASVEMKYAVRGEVVAKAGELKERLKKGENLPFEFMVPCNIGNPHAVKQKPITFYRQVGAACMCPSLLETSDFPDDVKARAREYLAATGECGIGSYTDSDGLAVVRQQVCDFIERRDGYPASINDISLTTGASEGVKRCLAAIISKSNDGVMIPCPQYPLYSASITVCGGTSIYYDLDEASNWKITRASLDAAVKNQTIPVNLRAIAVINPGNPSGSVLDIEDIEMIINFSFENQLVILADEVYQENVYVESKQFHSFKKVLRQMQAKDAKYKPVQLISFHSTSKGLIGECGQRGGYMEMIGFSDNFHQQMTKVAATSLSSNTIGQIFIGMMVTPPKPGDPSHALFKEESEAIFAGLKNRAVMLTKGLNDIAGLESQTIEGAMYAFAKIAIPKKAQEAAAQAGIPADDFWCLSLVEQTGIICVPGSGFGQREGTFHFRITILPPDDMLKGMLERLAKFQQDFLAKYGGDGDANQV